MEVLQITSFEQLPAGLTFISKQLAELQERLSKEPAPAPTPAEEKFYTRKETAERLKISEQTLIDYTSEGKITGCRLGTRILYKESDILAALKTIKPAKP